MAAEESIFSLREVRREREQPWDIEVCIGRRTPQALLRDLYRPVLRFGVSLTEFDHFTRPTGCCQPEMRAIREEYQKDLRVPIVDLLHTSKTMLEEYRDLRATLKKPWTDAPKFGPQYIPEYVSRRFFGD